MSNNVNTEIESKGSNETKDKEKADNFSKFLDNILRSAEGLEQGRKNETFSSIELDQISNFFTRIASNCEKTADGCLLLAQQGIDTASTDRLLNSLNNTNKKNEYDEINNNRKLEENNLQSVYRFTNAIEKCELDIFKEVDQNWDSLKKSIHFESYSNSIFSNDPSIRSIQALDAESFANAMRQVLSENIGSKIFIPVVEILAAWKNYYFGDDNNFESKNKIVDYITALYYITKSNKEFDFNEHDMVNLIQNGPSYEILKSLHENSKLYLELQYRYQKFVLDYKTDYNMEELNRKIMNFGQGKTKQNNNEDEQDDDNKDDIRDENSFTLKDFHYQDTNGEDKNKDKIIKWNFIWDLIRSGLSDLIKTMPIPKDDDVNSLISMIKGENAQNYQKHHENQIINNCFTYVTSEKGILFDLSDLDLSDPQTIVFYQIVNNLKHLKNPEDNNDRIFSAINEDNSKLLKDTLYEVPTYDMPVYDLLLFDFEKFVEDIIQLCADQFIDENQPSTEDVLIRLPVIAAHLALIFYNIGYLHGKSFLKNIINDLISILPLPQYADVALAYIALSRTREDEDDVINFLLSIDLNSDYFQRFDINIYNFDKDNFINMEDLLTVLYNDHENEAKTIKILAMFEYFDQSLECFNIAYGEDGTNINYNLNYIELSDIAIFVEVSHILLQNFYPQIKKLEEEEDKEDSNEENEKMIQERKRRIKDFEKLCKLAIRYTLHALANSDAFDLTQRIKVTKHAEKIYHYMAGKKKMESTEYFKSIYPMIQIAKIITAFESAKDDEAMRIAFNTEILPFHANKLGEAINYLETPGLKESSAIGTAIEIIVMHLSKTALKIDNDTKFLKSIIEFCKYLTLKEDVLANIIQIRIRLSLL